MVLKACADCRAREKFVFLQRNMSKLSFLLIVFLVLSGILLPARQKQYRIDHLPAMADTIARGKDSVLSRADSLIAFARQFIGTPYKYACASPKSGFDCSGFTYYVFAHAGITLPRSSSDLDKAGYDVPLKECRKGDLILFKGTDANSTRVGHVGIIISEEGEPVEFIHSSSSKKHWGVVISSMEKDYYTKRFVKVKRVL
jgi:cell wall-associated NlpC family hydrolase